MVYCGHCVQDRQTIRDDKGFLCCLECGTVLSQDLYTDEPEFTKDSHGQARVSGERIRSADNSWSISRSRTLERANDVISDIVSQLEIGGGSSTVDPALRLYEIALDKNFTKGRRASHVAAACVYIICRRQKKPYLLIDFSDHLMISVYVLGAVFLQLCELLKLSEHPSVQGITDPSLFIHRFTDRLLGRSNDAVARTALQIIASMKRDWMQTGRKPSGLCGAAIYISVLSHGLNYSKSDVVTVVHICETTLTKRLIEFENTESGSLTIEEFITRADAIDKDSEQRQHPKPGEVICEHKKTGALHYAHGLCQNCFDEFMKISGGLEGGSEPPAFQRAEKQRVQKAKVLEKMRESCVDEIEAEISKIDSDSTRVESLASKEYDSFGVFAGEQAIDISNIDLQEVKSLDCNGPESLSDIDDCEVDGYLNNEAELKLKTIIWKEMNKDYLQEQELKEAAAKRELDQTGEVKAKMKRKRRSAEETKNSIPADSPLEATRQMLKKKPFSSKVNYEALASLYTTDQEKEANKLENSDAKSKQDLDNENANTSDEGAVYNEDEANGYDGNFDEVNYDPNYDFDGYEYENNGYDDNQDLDFD